MLARAHAATRVCSISRSLGYTLDYTLDYTSTISCRRSLETSSKPRPNLRETSARPAGSRARLPLSPTRYLPPAGIGRVWVWLSKG